MALRPGRTGSLLFVAGVYLLATAAAWTVFHRVDAHPMGAMALGLAASTAVTFLFVLVADNGSVFDAWWSVLPPVAALYFTELSGHPEPTPRQVAVHAVVWAWAVRLTANWVRGWPDLHHEDWRYRDLYARWPLPRWAVRATAVTGFPTIVVILGCLPLHPALSLGDAGFGPLDAVALTVGLGAVGIELAADEQLHAFARNKAPGEILDQGLWRWSRHPNYFGEIGFWVSLWLFAVAAEPAYFWTAVGPAAVIALFVGASVPLLDERSAARRPGFVDYAARTRAIVPWPRRRARPGGPEPG